MSNSTILSKKRQHELDATDYVRAVVNILEDIGDEKQRLETTQKAVLNILEDLEDEKSSAQEASRMKSEFLANMSHELRTPLNSIIGFSELMSDGKVGPIADNHKEYLGDILTSAKHLLQLINDVLDLAKVEAGKLDFDCKSIDIQRLIYEIRDTLRSIAASRDISVDIQIADNLKEVLGDAARIKQVLYNYLSNALKFTHEGGKVSISAERTGDAFFTISVTDSGDGIADENISRLFVEFEQLDASIGKRHQGTGLGLALTKRIVEAQGGEVGVESVLGEGSMFYATLPICLRPVFSDDNSRSFNLDNKNLNLPKVLIIEDEPELRNEYINLLILSGYEPYGVSTGEEAIRYAKLQLWDVITLDLNLPDICGSQVLSIIRSETVNAQTPVIVITALLDKSISAFSVQEIIIKPAEPKTIIQALKRTTHSSNTNIKIMVIDDDPNDLELVHQHLKNAGYKSVCFNNGNDALKALDAESPDAIILDLFMPEISGTDILKQLKQEVSSCEIPVILWTDNECDSLIRRTEYSTAESIVTKGQGHEALLEELKRHTEKENSINKRKFLISKQE